LTDRTRNTKGETDERENERERQVRERARERETEGRDGVERQRRDRGETE
jgi:hypothetical protein